MFTAWRTTMARISALASSAAPRPRRASPAPRVRLLDCYELEERTLLSASPAAAAASPQTTDSTLAASAAAPVQAAATSTIAAQYAALPLGFEPNMGQAGNQVDFVANGNGYQVALEQGNAVIQLAGANGIDQLTLNLLGANPNAQGTAQSLEAGQANYLLGNNPSGWITGVPMYAGVQYSNVYSGVNLLYYGNQQQLEYTFTVAPGANPNQIQLSFTGSQSMSVDAAGDLVITMPGSSQSIVFEAPVAYQNTAAGVEPVTSRYEILPDGQVTFALGSYDASQPLVIDPLLDYGTFLGGTNADQINGIAVDSSGDTFLAGETASGNFPTSSSAYDSSKSGTEDAFVTELNPSGTAVIYSTYLGGSGTDVANAIAVDSSGNAYVTGSTTSNNFPTHNAFQSSNGGGQDAFITKLNSTGSGLLYSSYFGDSGSDEGLGIAVDNSGTAYMVGQVYVTTTFSLLGLLPLGSSSTDDGFIVEVDTTKSGNSSAPFDALLAGSNSTAATSVAVDGSGDIYIGGWTQSSDFPTTGNAYKGSFSGGTDGFLTVYNSSDNVTYSTYLSGSGTSSVNALALGPTDNVYLTGWTSGGLPTTAGAYQSTYGGGTDDAFVSEFNPTKTGNSSLVYSTYLGGSGDDQATGIAVNSSGQAAVTGFTSGSFPVTADAYQLTYAGGTDDGFFSTISASGAGLIYSTYLGGSGDDEAEAIAEDGSGGIYIAGYTASSDFDELTSGAYDTSLDSGAGNGQDDGFIVKFTTVAANTAPVLAAANNLTTILENATGNSGTLVSALIAGQITDPDPGAVSGIAVTAVNTTNGAWQYSADGGTTWVAIGSVSTTSALLLPVGSVVRFVPNAYWSGTVSSGITFQAWDETSGTSYATANVNTNGGSTAFSTASASSSIDVTWVNSAPAGTSNTVTTLENAAYTFQTADFGFSDPHDSPANSLLAVKIDALPGAGNLTDNGVAVTAGQSVSAADISAGLLKFTPAAYASGANYASFTFQVQDNGGTANGGVDLDPSAKTMAVNVTWVNSAPSGTSSTVTTLENAAYTFQAADFGFSDPHDSPANSLLAVKIDALPTAGSLTDNGVAVAAGQSVSAADINAGLLKFAPAAYASGTNYASFTFQVQDNGGTANGGVDLDPSAKTMAVNVTWVNSAPSGTSNTVTTLENAAYSFQAADFGFSDPHDSPANSLLAVKIDALPSAGSLTDNGVAVTAGQSVSAADISAGLLKFTPAAYASGANYASFTFQVQDNGGTANGGVDLDPSAKTMAVNVTWVNSAPSGTNNTVTTLENTAYTLQAADFGFTDPHDSPANSLLAVKIDALPTAGSLTDNGAAVIAGQSVSAADINAGLLKFTPVAYASGANYASFTFQLQDNGGTANGGVDLDPVAKTMAVNVTWVNSAPVLAGANNLAPILMDDTSNAGTLVSTLIAGQVADHDGPPSGIAVVAVDDSHGTWQYSLNAGANWTNIGSVSSNSALLLAADANTLVRFVPAANWVGNVSAGLTFQAWDQTSGVAGGTADVTSNGGSTAFSTAVAASGILVNNSPVLNGANDLASIQVNQFNNAGTPVSALLTGQVTEANPAATVGIAVVGVNNSNGVWQYSLNGGQTWLGFASPSPSAALLLPATPATLVRFVPTANWSGTLAGGLTFRAWDQTSGTAGATVDASLGGGSTAFSAATAAAGITVNLVNPTILVSQSLAPSSPVATAANNSPAASGPILTGSTGPLPAPLPAVEHAKAATAISILYTAMPTDFGQVQAPIIVRPAAQPIATVDSAPIAFAMAATAPTPSKFARSTSMAGIGSALLWSDLDSLKQQVQSAIQPEVMLIGSALTVSTGLTVGYVIWMVRGGMLISSLVAQMPAWRLIDPLVVLNRFDELDSSDDEDDESLGSILETADQAS
jgi:hypothetical protein